MVLSLRDTESKKGRERESSCHNHEERARVSKKNNKLETYWIILTPRQMYHRLVHLYEYEQNREDRIGKEA